MVKTVDKSALKLDFKNNYIAHVKQNKSGDWSAPHFLEEHLRDVENLARLFSDGIGSDWAGLSGRWHDLGKYRDRFQDYIRLKSGYERENAHVENGTRAPHSTAGAMHAIKTLPLGQGHILAYLIAGHHAGLSDWNGGKGSLGFRVKDAVAEYEEAICKNIPADILQCEPLSLPSFIKSQESISLWMRMLFSCLVDADFLDTEMYMQPEKSQVRKQNIDLDVLLERFSTAMAELQKNSNVSSLNSIRNKILDECYGASEWQPGMFSLTVPTGGGKTLSSLAFALRHAKIYGKKRVIYAIPFTSIIEQNASVFRDILGDDAVLEHHSNLDVKSEKESSRSRLASENWDAPLIVTTNVQLFESLHASRTSRCRKLHNIMNSVIILDEAQQLPRDFHAPITKIMQQLSNDFGVTWVLCTATQPVLSESKNTFGQLILKGLTDVREIVKNPTELAYQLKRVDVQLPSIDDPKLSWQALAENIILESSVLAIVNTRRQAKELFELLPNDGNKLHLSANMCAQHRTEVIGEIKERLKQRLSGDQRPLRVISTQLIEAGVDVDFPVVYRAMAGLDSIAQSAGRCNREDKLDGLGRVVVFKPEQSAPIGFLRQGEEVTMEMIASGQLVDPLSPESFEQYFTLMNSKGERDKYDILTLLRPAESADTPLSIQFRTAAEKFRLIDNKGTAIIVPFKPKSMEKSPVDGWLKQLEFDPLLKKNYKKLQRYTVTVPEYFADALQEKGCTESRAGLVVLLEVYYQSLFGIESPDSLIEAERCIV